MLLTTVLLAALLLFAARLGHLYGEHLQILGFRRMRKVLHLDLDENSRFVAWTRSVAHVLGVWFLVFAALFVLVTGVIASLT